MGELITYVGLDVHKDTISVALVDGGIHGEVREHGKITNTPAAMKTLITNGARRPCAADLLRGWALWLSAP